MRSQIGFGMMMVMVAVMIIGVAIFFFYQTGIVPQIKAGTGELTALTVGEIALVKSATSACEVWRSPQSFYDPSALSASMVEAISKVFPDTRCSQDTPLGCEQACSCLLKLNKYCHIGDPGGTPSACKAEPCRVIVEG
jgi:hypothetical protein